MEGFVTSALLSRPVYCTRSFSVEAAAKLGSFGANHHCHPGNKQNRSFMPRTLSILLLIVFILSSLVVSAQHADAQSTTLTFAAVGDYGVNNEYEAAVASMVDGWNPDLILALGDNYYLEAGGTGSETYDLAVGKYYCRFLRDITTTGTACPGGQSSINRFFPALGDHD